MDAGELVDFLLELEPSPSRADRRDEEDIRGEDRNCEVGGRLACEAVTGDDRHIEHNERGRVRYCLICRVGNAMGEVQAVPCGQRGGSEGR